MIHFPIRVVTGLLGLLLWLFPVSNALALEKVVLQLRWDHQFQFAGYYAALWQGYYAEAGFEVEIRSAITPDGKILSAIDEVAGGRADFGVGAADILIARDQGIPLVVLASIFQQSAAEFYAKESTLMQAPADLLKLRVARRVNDLIDVELQAMLRAEGIDPQKITPYPHGPGIEHLMTDQVQVMPGYRSNAPYIFRQQHVPVRTLRPINYGVDFYGDSLFTHTRRLERDPKAVERLVEATRRGWQYALDHPVEIADHIAQILPRVEPVTDNALQDFNRFQIDGIKALTLYPFVEIGHINPNRWWRMNEFMRDLGIITQPLDINALIFYPEQYEQDRHQQIYQRWQIAFLVIAGSILLIFFWNWLLRKTLKQRTRQLRETNQDLQISEARLQRVLAGTNDGFWDWNIVTGEALFSPRWAEMLGYDLINIEPQIHSWENRVHPDDMPRCRTTLHAHFAGEIEHYQCEHRMLAKTGEWRWVLDRGKVTARDAEGRPLWMAGTHTDITERKRMEEAIRLFKAVVESSEEAIAISHPSGELLYINPAHERLFGRALEQANTLNYRAYYPPESVEILNREVAPCLARGESWEGELEVFDSAGHRFPLWERAGTVRDADGNMLYGFGFMHDITERKRMETELRASDAFTATILNALTDRIAVVDGQGLVTRINRAWSQFAEANHAPELAQASARWSYRSICLAAAGQAQGDIALAAWTGIEAVLTGQQDTFYLEYPCDTPEKPYWFRMKVYPLQAPASGAVIAHEDITAQKQLAEDLRVSLLQVQTYHTQALALNRMNNLLLSCETRAEAYEVIGISARTLFAGCSGLLAIRDGATPEALRTVARWGNAQNLPAAFPLHDCWALRRGELHEALGGTQGMQCRHLTTAPTMPYLCAPLIVGGKTLGLLHLEIGGDKPCDSAFQKWRTLLLKVSSSIKMVLSNLTLQETLREQAIHDPLTRLFNRRYMDEVLTRELHRCRRTGEPLAVAMLDLDHFKGFNDTFGHEAGDLILRGVGNLLLRSLRAGDFACRYGGEELILILPGATGPQAHPRLDSLRQAIADLRLVYRDTELPMITTSIGIAEAGQGETDATALIGRADAALYRAKQSGRNRVMIADASES